MRDTPRPRRSGFFVYALGGLWLCHCGQAAHDRPDMVAHDGTGASAGVGGGRQDGGAAGSTSAAGGGNEQGEGGSPSTPEAGGNAGTGPSTGPGGTSASDGGDKGQDPPAGACPPSLPRDGSPCENGSLHCTFGDTADFACRDAATCTQEQWNIVPSTCDKTPCPADTEHRTPCTTPSQQCSTTDGDECLCVEITPGNAQWFCDVVEDAQPNPDCPPLPPNAGTSCEFEGTCTYARCEVLDSTVRATCGPDGVWLVEAGPCEVITDGP